ncbi:MAG TPA: sigma-70 family RNA polymerase sigma factor [Chloroflexia bacterium]|nr:sigma-70 family RNA polymerase sigma factor [Chloroflexia bacterium]
MEEDDLIRRAQGGDPLAFRRLVETYAPLAARTARAYLPDRVQAEDAVQEAWLDAWRSLPRFQAGRPFRPWLLTLVANRCRMSARRGRSRWPLAGAWSPPAADGEAAEAHALRAAGDPELQAALATLRADQQQVLALRYYADLELDEIARLTNTPLGTVKSRLHRALRSLRAQLAPVPVAAPGVQKGLKL